MMSASLFSTLPPELICQVFEFADDFSVVAALAQTARIFYQTWRENPTSICQAVAPRIFSNLTDAERLLDIQEEAEVASQSQDSREQRPIIRAKRLLSNARCASAAIDNWVGLLRVHEYPRGPPRGPMTPSEIARFEHAFYCVWIIGVMGSAPHLQDQASAFLDKCSPRELVRLDELAIWGTSYNNNDFGSIGLDFYDEAWRVAFDLVKKRLVTRTHWVSVGIKTPLYFFAFFDHTQRFLDTLPDE